MLLKQLWCWVATPSLLLLSCCVQAQLTLQWQTWQNAEFDPSSPVSESIKRDEYLVNYQWRNDDQERQVTYAHQPLLIRSGEPGHNGYFHRLDYGIHNQNGNLSIVLTTGLHGSSNMFNHAKFHDESVVVSGEILYKFKACNCEFGFNGDYRFGPFHYYPVAQKQWQLDDGVRLKLSLPYGVMIADENKQWQVGIERYGDKWGALDRSREVESSYFLEEWQLKGSYQLFKNLYRSNIYANLGYSFDSTVRYLDLIAGKQEKNLESTWFVGVFLVYD